MGAYRDENKNGTWYCKFSYVNWKGQKLNKKKRGFSTKKEALAWEKEFLNGQAGSVELTFREFFELYKRDKKPRRLLADEGADALLRSHRPVKAHPFHSPLTPSPPTRHSLSGASRVTRETPLRL